MKNKSHKKNHNTMKPFVSFRLLALLLCFISASMSATISAQQKEKQTNKKISGIVKDEKGEPIIGAAVFVKGTKLGTATDVNGKFSINVSDQSILTISYMGYETAETPVTAQKMMSITLKEDTKNLDEVVVIGYGSIRKRDLTGSVGEVKVNDLVKAPVSSFAEALAGRVAGVQVNSADGQPGAGVSITIRGNGSLTQSTSPLYVIDGIAIEGFDPLTMNSEEIESMSILKDASSTAIYGARGANGVILIQTKRGNIGKSVVTFSSSFGYQQVPKQVALMSPYDFVKYQMELNPSLTSTNEYFTYDATLGRQRTLDDYKNIKGINFQDYLLRTGNQQNYDISLRGGNAYTKYSISGSVYDLKGAIINTGLNRYTGRVTIDQKISNKFSVGITVSSTAYDQNGLVVNQPPTSSGLAQPTSYLFISAWMYRPVSTSQTQNLLTDLADAEAGTTSDIRINPLLSQRNQYAHQKTNLLATSGYIQYDITKELVFKTTAGYWDNRYVSSAFYNSLTIQGSGYNLNNIDGINGFITNTITNNISNTNTLTFKNTNKYHHLTAMALFETIQNKTNSDGYAGRLLPNENLGISGIDEGTTSRAVMSISSNTMASFAGRLDYNYKYKYLLTASYRADGSSKFSQHWGYFPSASVAWNMQSEPFFEKLFPKVSKSKLRFGYGAVGNNRVGDFDYRPRLTFDNTYEGYPIDNSTPTGGIYESNVGNMNLKWETVKTLDVGYELGLFKNKLTVEAGVYRKETMDLLLYATLPPTTGFGSAFKNIGELRNDGLEITINSYNINTPKFKWQTSFNISFNRNKVMALTNGQQSLGSTASYINQFGKPLYLAEVGKSSGMMVGYIWDGNYQYPDFDQPSPGIYVLKPNVSGNGTVARSTIQPGDIKYKDLNGDGTMTDADVTFIGRGQPIHIGGISNNFSYKGFELNVFFSWSYGNDIFNANRLIMEGNSNGWALANQYATYANRWSPTNPSNLYYRTRGQGPIGFFSSRTVEDGSYLKLRTVSLSYSVPSHIIKKLYMSNLTFNVSGQNLITWTKYSGMDPEVSARGNVLTPGYDYSCYPRSPMIVFGLKAAF